MRNVTGSEHVHRASFLTGVFFLMKPLLVDNMLTGVFSVFEEKCVTRVPGGHEHLLIATPL